MPITPQELANRFRDHGEIIRNETDEEIKRLENENAKLKNELENLKNKLESNSGGGNGGITLEKLHEIFGKENFDENGKYKGGVKTVYKLNEPNNNGLDPQELTDALEKLKEENQWKSKEYKPLTADILNRLLADFFDKDAKKENLEGWLEKLGGYTLDKEPAREITVAEVKEVNGREEFTGKLIEVTMSGAEVNVIEEKWSKEERVDLQGARKLVFVHDLIDFNLDDYRPKSDGTYNKDAFAKLNENGQVNMNGKGVAPILTGGGKTTKDVACLVNGGKTNVVLVCPNEALTGDAEYHHTNWLQKNPDTGEPYKCVLHGVHHGFYKTVINDLTYYENKTDPNNVKKEGTKGLSILEAEKLFGYIGRSAVKIADLKEPTVKKIEELKAKGTYNENWKSNLEKIKTKLIPKDETIIVFDEAHFTKDAKYQTIYKQLIKNNYQVIIMSATFPKKKFSISTSHPRNVWLVPKFEPELIDDGKGGKIEKWSIQKTQIFLPSTEDEWELSITGQKIKQIKWNGLTAKQKKLLDDNDIAYVPFDKSNEKSVSAITQRMPAGSLFLANSDHEMGFSPFIHNVITTGKEQSTSLGKDRDTPWLYFPQITDSSLASMIQRIGRVARLFPGDAYLLTKILQDVDEKTGQVKPTIPSKDLSYKFVLAIISGDLTSLINAGITNMGKVNEPNFLRGAVSLDYMFGQRPETIIVGLKGEPVPYYPTYGNKPHVVDEELWNEHLGNPTPPTINKETSKQTMLLIIMDSLKKQSSIATKIDVSFSNSLIKNAWGKEVVKDGKTEIVIGEEENEEAVEEIKRVLHTVCDGYRKGLAGYEEDKIEYSESEKDTFNKLVNLYKVINGVEIKVGDELDNGKMKTIIKINYPVVIKGRRALILEEKIDTWRCHRCLKINNGYRFCEECGIDIRIQEEEQKENELVQELETKIEIPPK